MKIIVEPSSAMTVAALLGQSALDSASSRDWQRIVNDIISRRQERGNEHRTIRACVIVGGGNVSFDKVFGWFKDAKP